MIANKNEVPRWQSGFSLIELMIVLSITAVVLIGVAKYQKLQLDRIKSVDAAQKLLLVGKASVDYLNANLDALDALPGPNRVKVLTVDDLKQLNSCGTKRCLSENFLDQTFWGAKHAIRYTRAGTVPPYIYTVSVTTVADTGPGAITIDNEIRLDLAAYAAENVADGVGFTVSHTGLVRAYGPHGGWRVAQSNHPGIDIDSYSTNTVGAQLFFTHAQIADPHDKYYLRQDGLNSMGANLNLGGKGIYNVGYGVNNSGITAANSTSANNAIITNGLTVNGETTIAGNTNVTGNLTGTNAANFGSLSSSGTLSVTGNANLNSSLNANSTMNVTGDISAGSDLRLNTASGDIKMAGLLLSKGTDSVKSLTPNLVEVASFLVGDGVNINPPTCGAGGSPRIFVIPSSAIAQVFAGNAGYIFSALGPASGPWTINAKDSEGNSLIGPSIALARTFCSF